MPASVKIMLSHDYCHFFEDDWDDGRFDADSFYEKEKR